MTWYPLAFLPPQLENTSGEPYSGAVLKAYEANTTTVIPMATDVTGATTANSFPLNASGYPTHNGSVIIPHVQENFKLALYPTQAAADADSGALWTVDDIQIAEDTNQAFVEYFDGDGTTTLFNLSEDLGTDEKILMVFADRKLPDFISNGTMASDTIWTKGSGWTIGAGVATATGAISTAISQTAILPIIQYQAYVVEYTITRSAGGLIPSIGGTNGTERTASGTYKEVIVAGSNQTIAFTGNAFTGTLDSVTVKPAVSSQRQILRPLDDYTLNANQLTLTEAPPTGTKNIIVFAPSLLLGAASNAAAAAATSETNAAASAAAAAADKLVTEADALATEADLAILEADAATTEADIVATEADLLAVETDHTDTEVDLATTESDVMITEGNLTATEADATTAAVAASAAEADLVSTENDVAATEADLAATEADLVATEADLGAVETDAAAVESDAASTLAMLLTFGPHQNEPPATNYATLDQRNGHTVLDFDTTTQEAAIFTGVMPHHYAGQGLTVYVIASLTSATTGTLGWVIDFERIGAAQQDIDSDGFGSQTTLTATTVPGTSGHTLVLSANVANGSAMDSIAAGELFRIRVQRDVANDTAAGDAELLKVVIKGQ